MEEQRPRREEAPQQQQRRRRGQGPNFTLLENIMNAAEDHQHPIQAIDIQIPPERPADFNPRGELWLYLQQEV